MPQLIASNHDTFFHNNLCLLCFVRLSLELFNQCILVEWAAGHIEQMTKSLDEVFNNANGFEDTLRAAMVKLAFLRST